MKFSLRNILFVIAFIAILLGHILSDKDSEIKGRAVQLEYELELIEKAKSFRQPLVQADLASFNFNEFNGVK